jgi:hypothetical protein
MNDYIDDAFLKLLDDDKDTTSATRRIRKQYHKMNGLWFYREHQLYIPSSKTR